MVRGVIHERLLICRAAALLLLFRAALFGQTGSVGTATPSDTLTRAAAVQDTVHPSRTSSGIDSVVTYSATDSIRYSIDDKTMRLFGKGDIKYKELGLKAERIDLNWKTSMLNAFGVRDTSDTSGSKMRGIPDLVDGGELYHGSRVAYNFKTKKGKIDVGKTEIEKGYYYGQAIKKVDPDVLFVADGRYTTCDLDHPHYYFFSPEMKVTVKDKVVARPVYLYIADVPVFALPFGVFPNERGRRSGVIAPAYGESSHGRYLLHLGYYWAINDYFDWNIRGDGYTKGSWVLYSDFRYALRYNFTGSISGSYARSISGERGDPDYSDQKLFNLRINHSQDIDPTTRLVADFTFTSGSYYQQTSNNLNDLLRQNVVSNATLTKVWEGATQNSMTVNIRRDQNLQAQPGQVEVSEILPSVSFNRSQSFPFRFGKRTSTSGEQAWYELIGYSYSGEFLNSRTSTKLALDNSVEEHYGIQHQVPVNLALKLGYFNLTPFFNYTEKWYDRSIRKTVDPSNDSLIVSEVKGFNAVRSYATGVSASTRFYGMFTPGIFGIKGIRHQVQPTLSYTYQPDFSRPHFGYYGSYTDTSGQQFNYSFHEKEVFGGAPAGEQQAITLGIGNIFEMKTESSDTSKPDNKFQLLNLNLGIGYNFAADSLRFSPLNMDFRTNVGQLLSIGGSSSFNLYKFEVGPRGIGRRVNKFLLKEEGRLAQLTSFGIQIGTRFSGERKESKAGPVLTEADSLRQKSGVVNIYDETEPDFSIPWNLDLTWNFSQNQSDPRFKFRSSNLSVGLGFNLTEFWKINASTNYDIINRQFAAPLVTVYRDLHCWELNFSWVPTGQYRYYRLEIRLKAPQLQDVKVTKQSSARGIF